MMENVDFDESTSVHDHVNFVCTQREYKPNKTIIEQDTICSMTCFCWSNKELFRDENFTRKQ